jgi:hypothetical protein
VEQGQAVSFDQFGRGKSPFEKYEALLEYKLTSKLFFLLNFLSRWRRSRIIKTAQMELFAEAS